ncbi:Response regulator of zinc sigma-54-dependent two-component system [Labilithrix luteola]|uniref:Response regulator of zinc sigma-54-dependent two-component system n=2 Tax=Labilithrix luteola TaxID=1391654 RepID=A0A0K1QEH9_9BACT|nr:Response regulator of zinc sigma-54-dependent two-component system [Labilithrix luteola]
MGDGRVVGGAGLRPDGEGLPNEGSDRWLEEPTFISGSTKAPALAFRLTVKEGPNVGEVVVVDEGSCPVFAGTSETCALRLTDREVSRRHVRFEMRSGQLRINDISSTNGTMVNGLRVVEAMLAGGEVIRVGGTTIGVSQVIAPIETSAPAQTSFGSFCGGSLPIRRLYPLCAKLAASDVPVVIEGETGTGKEALAEAIHRAGHRANKPFVVFDCTAVPPSLLESALFGHELGAFTGADSTRRGIFEEADGGTLLIDEIGELDLGLQSRLLRAIQKSEVRRIGGTRWLNVDVRVIVATRRDLDVEVAAGRFRDDLFFRLAVGRLSLPPLRDRRDDVELLARYLWDVHSKAKPQPFPEEVLARLISYDWPGNVRELSNTMARLAAFGDLASGEGGELFMSRVEPVAATKEDYLDAIIAEKGMFSATRDRVVAEFERRYIAYLDGNHPNEQARVKASGVTDRYLRLLRNRARTMRG